MSDSLPSSCVFFLPTVFLFWRFDSFNTSLSFSVACPAQRHVHTPSALTVNAVWARKNVSQIRKKTRGFLPPYVPCSNPPPALTSSPVPPSFFSRCASVNRTSGRDYWEWTLQLVWVTFVRLRVCLSSDRRNFKNQPSCPLLCASMWELLSPSSWTLTFDQALIQSLVVVEKGRLRGDSREAPLSTHSQCFIYGPLHFWLWWLQYLSSYLNCIFKGFIQYLHAIQYELIFVFFANHFFLFVSYLIVFILAWFVTIIHKQTCPLDLFQA